MAVNRTSTFLDPISARFSRLPENYQFARKAAKHQESVIHDKLKRAGEPIPPYEFISMIGKGTYGRVYLSRDQRSDRRVAIKVIDVDVDDYKAPSSDRNAGLDLVMREFKVLMQLKGINAENVNRLYDAFNVHSQIWIVTEFCPGGTVHTLMQAMENRIEERYIRVIARELAKGLKAVHAADIIHRDIKAANVIIHEEGGLQIIDFGVAAMLQSKSDKRNTVIGTPHWMDPELLRGIQWENGKIPHGKEADTWSYGCFLIEMATGQPPNFRIPQSQIEKHVRKRGPPRLKVEDGYSEEFCDFVAFTLESDPAKRPTMEDILQHPYLRDTEESHPTSSLVELVKKYEQWARTGGQRNSLLSPYGAEAAELSPESVTKMEWRFSTLETTELLEEMSSDPSFDPADIGDDDDDDTVAVDRSPAVHIDPIADMSSAQAQEDSLNSYFAGAPAEEYFDELADTIYKPNSSPQPFMKANFATDEASVRRGANHLGSLFGQHTYRPEKSDNHRPPSDLPLRSQTAGSSRQDTDNSSIGSSRSAKTLANIDTMRANSYNARPPTMNMSWEFPSKPAASGSHPNLNIWGPNDELEYGSPSDDFESSHDEAPNAPPSRPALRHAATEPVHYPNAKNTTDLARGSRLDMDALLGVSDSIYAPSSLQETPPYQHSIQSSYPSTEAGEEVEGLDLDTMMSGGEVELPPLSDSYTDPGVTPKDIHRDQQPSEHINLKDAHAAMMPVPQPPSEEALTAGAPQMVLQMELGRLAEEFVASLGTIGQHFETLLGDEGVNARTSGDEAPLIRSD